MVLIGTTNGLFRDDEDEPLIGGTRINHVSGADDDWWAVDGKGRIHHNGDVVAMMPGGSTPLCIQPTPETVWIGATEARLYALERDQLAEDEFFAEAPGRDKWYTPWGAPADVRSMTLDADHTLYVNVHVGGILRYDNTGVVPTLDISADVHQVAAHPHLRGAVFAACAHGLAYTHNGHDFEIRDDGLHAPYCRAVAVLEDRVLVSASTGPSTDGGRLYVGDLWEGRFEQVTGGLPDWFNDNVDTHCVSAHATTAHVGHGDTVWRSDDAGQSWTVIRSKLAKITCLRG